jgi:hypothetical protein
MLRIVANKNTATIGPHNGLVTVHHDQLATIPTFANLSVRNIRNIIKPIPIPPEFLLEFDIFLCLFCKDTTIFLNTNYFFLKILC